jgi:glutathione peroxidase
MKNIDMTIYDYEVKQRDWSQISLRIFKWKVLIIVNTATGCGFTPQYEWLENLYKKHHEKWLEILDFPCDQFGHQAPWSDDEIHQFCTMKYNTTFDQFSKIEVNWENELPLYTYLKEQQPNEEVQWLKNKASMAAIKAISKSCKKDGDIVWNFTKFLVDRDWNVIKRYDPTFRPEDIEKDILELL